MQGSWAPGYEKNRTVPGPISDARAMTAALGLEHEAMLGPQESADTAAPCDLPRALEDRDLDRRRDGSTADLDANAIAEPKRRRHSGSHDRHERARHPRRPRGKIGQSVEDALWRSFDGEFRSGDEGHRSREPSKPTQTWQSVRVRDLRSGRLALGWGPTPKPAARRSGALSDVFRVAATESRVLA